MSASIDEGSIANEIRYWVGRLEGDDTPARTWPSKKEKLKAELAESKTLIQKLETLVQQLETRNTQLEERSAQLEKGNTANELAVKQALGELVSSDARIKDLEDKAQALAKKVADAEASQRACEAYWRDQLAEAQEQARITMAVDRCKLANMETYVRKVEANLRGEHQAMLKWRETAKRTGDALGQMSRCM